MKPANASTPSSEKTNAAPLSAAAPTPASSAWAQTVSGDKRPDAPQPPPVWTRYIDSRLKQFCAR